MRENTKETIIDTYKRQLCKICKNKDKNYCEIRKCIDGVIRCIYYEK